MTKLSPSALRHIVRCLVLPKGVNEMESARVRNELRDLFGLDVDEEWSAAMRESQARARRTGRDRIDTVAALIAGKHGATESIVSIVADGDYVRVLLVDPTDADLAGVREAIGKARYDVRLCIARTDPKR